MNHGGIFSVGNNGMPESFQYSMIVNQKLAFAKIQLDTGKKLLSEMKASESAPIDSRLKVHAYLDAAILELNKALIYFVAEIASSNDLKKISEHHQVLLRADNFRVFLKFTMNIFPSVRELQELWSLLNKQDTWLQRLFSYIEDPIALATSFVSLSASKNDQEVPVNDSVIKVVNISSGDEALSPEVFISSFIGEMHSLIDRQRANLEEY